MLIDYPLSLTNADILGNFGPLVAMFFDGSNSF